MFFSAAWTLLAGAAVLGAQDCQQTPLEVAVSFVVEKDCPVGVEKINAAFAHLKKLFPVSELNIRLSLGQVTGVAEESLYPPASPDDVLSDTSTEEAALARLQRHATRISPLGTARRTDLAVFLFSDQDSGGISGVSKESGVFSGHTAILARVKNADSPRTIAEITGHEIAHVLGSAHDGEHNTCGRGHLMEQLYTPTDQIKTLSPCSVSTIKRSVKKLQCAPLDPPSY